jgi:hypothetical protein
VKHYCEFCGQTSYDDSRGGCACCGAPRARSTGPGDVWDLSPRTVNFWGDDQVIASGAYSGSCMSFTLFPVGDGRKEMADEYDRRMRDARNAYRDQVACIASAW